MATTKESFMFTVGKLDAGMAILLGERAHLIEFPSVLLPPGAAAGSIVNISVQQNHAEEAKRDTAFWALQDDILDAFGRNTPAAPQLEVRNVTQTSVTLEWPPLELATATLRSLDIHRNGARLAAIPAPLQNTSTKLSGLELDTPYTFQLFLRTSAGTHASPVLSVRTHTMANTSGIAVCFGAVQDPVALERAKLALGEMGARWADRIQIDTTHFVCTTPAATPASGAAPSAPGVEYQRALQLSIPVVQPAWVLACRAEGRMVPIAGYYLGATPAAPMDAPPFARPASLSQVPLPRSPASAGGSMKANRASMPPMARAETPRSPESAARAMAPFPEADEREPGPPEIRIDAPTDAPAEDADDPRIPLDVKKKMRKGTMDRNFRFPPATPEGTPPVPAVPGAGADEGGVEPASIDVPPPPPPPVEKEPRTAGTEDDEDVGATVEIPL